MQERTTRGGAGEVAWGRLASKFWRQPAQKSAWSLIISQKPLKEQGTNKSTRFGAYSHLHASAGVHPAVFALHPSSAPFPQMCPVLFWWEAAPVLGTAHRMCASTSARLQRWVQMKKQWCASYQRHWECPEENRAPAPAFIRVKGYSWAAGDAVQRKNAEKVVKKNPQQLINLIRSVANSKKNLDHILHS